MLILVKLLSITVSQPREEGLSEGQEDSLSREEDSLLRLADGIDDSLQRIPDSQGRRIAWPRKFSPVKKREYPGQGEQVLRVADSLAKESWANPRRRRAWPRRAEARLRRANLAKQEKKQG